MPDEQQTFTALPLSHTLTSNEAKLLRLMTI